MICVPIKKKTLKSLLENLKLAQKKADLVEIRFDELKLSGKDLVKIFETKKKPIIYKSKSNLKNIEEILKNKPEYIDIDIKTNKKVIKRIRELAPKIKIIMSFHDFKKTPVESELKKVVKVMKKTCADIYKIATFAQTFGDSLRMLSFLDKFSKKYKIICLCMGKEGQISRVAGHLLGNYLTYAPLNDADKTAEGQISVSELKKLICL